ncbi:MAG: winged helix-turn-helix domain-containing protein [Burkholderiales bacterium]|nr:winged helix-turn-helix domain-containing protein [Anaerolineae bacterium]
MQKTNLFFHRGPIRDRSHFFNRQREVSQALSLVANGQSVSLIGPRRIGKTSFLFYITDPQIAASQGLRADEFLFVYIDCGTLSGLDQAGIFRGLLEDARAAMIERGLSIPFDTLDDLSPISFRAFEQALGKLFAQRLKPVLMLDEFELLSHNPALGPDFFSGLRALASRYPLSYFTASRQPLLELTYANSSALSSPFFNIFATIRLRLLTDEDAHDLLKSLAERGGYAFSEQTITALLEMAGPQPLFLQMAGYHAFDLDQTDADELERRFTADAYEHFVYAWRTLSAAEKWTLATFPASQNDDVDALRSLEQKCLIVRQQAGYEYFSAAFRAFAQSQPVDGLLQSGPIAIDGRSHQALLRGQALKITQSQYDLLSILIEQPGRVVSNEDLERALWGETFIDDPERLKSVIKGLRRALGDDAARLENVRGIGYLWRGGKIEMP